MDFKLPGSIYDINNNCEIDDRPGITFVVIMSNPASRGFIKLRSSDSLYYPIIEPQYFDNQSDVKQFINGIKFLEEFTRTIAFASLYASTAINKIKPCEHEVFNSDEYWACFVGHVFVGHLHAGTCKMGLPSDPHQCSRPTT